jgi:chorismate mutase
MSAGLDELRARIDAVDDELIEALARRARLVDEVAALKRAHGLGLRDVDREQAIVNRALARAPSRLSPGAITAVIRAILAACYPTDEGATPGG